MVTGLPGRSFSRLSTITRSPELRPDRMTQLLPDHSPVVTGRMAALPLSSTKTKWPFSVCITAVCGTV